MEPIHVESISHGYYKFNSCSDFFDNKNLGMACYTYDVYVCQQEYVQLLLQLAKFKERIIEWTYKLTQLSAKMRPGYLVRRNRERKEKQKTAT